MNRVFLFHGSCAHMMATHKLFAITTNVDVLVITKKIEEPTKDQINVECIALSKLILNTLLHKINTFIHFSLGQFICSEHTFCTSK